MSLHPSTARAIRHAWRATGRSLLATATITGVEPSTVRRVVGPLPRRVVAITDAMRASIVERRRCGVTVDQIAQSYGVGVERVRDVLAAEGIVGRVARPTCVLCGRASWECVAYEDGDAEPGERVCAPGAGCQSAAREENKEAP